MPSPKLKRRCRTVGRLRFALGSVPSTLSSPRRLLTRPRRLRRSAALRNLVRETNLNPHDFVLPLFVSEKVERRRPIPSMPGVFQLSLREVVDEARRAHDAGLQAVLIFGIPAHKDEAASGAYAEDGVVQQTVRALKEKSPD